jgi:shikimate kinase
MIENVYLIGGRAVGKSSIGVKLANRLRYKFLDTDALVTTACGWSVAEIVDHEGWPAFRNYEKQALLQLFTEKYSVVATGGGAILHRELWVELKKQGTVVWLMADPAILCKRIKDDYYSAAQRPSLTGKNICQELETVLKERNPLYQETADYIIDSGNMTIDEAVQEIMKTVIQQMGNKKKWQEILSARPFG